jgi:hypothetical protein
VNWDEIERQYAEMTPTNPQAYQPPPSQDSRVTPDLFMKGEDDGTTLAENPARHRTGSNIPTSDCTLNSIENANRQPHIIKPDHVS